MTLGDGGTCGGFSSPDPQCNTCLSSSCCSEATTCGANTSCAAISTCIQACADDTCSQGCLTSNAAGAADYNALTGCVSNSCMVACSGAAALGDGGACGGFVFDTAECTSCFASSCCSAGSACSANADCVALDTCLGDCASGDTTCENACASASPNGTADLSAVGDCITGTCGAACGFVAADAGSCGGFSSDEPCTNTCVTTTCCAQGAACGANVSCLQLFSCIQSCAPNDSNCAQTCANQNPGGVSAYNAAQVCLDSCGCSATDGGTSGATDAAAAGGG